MTKLQKSTIIPLYWVQYVVLFEIGTDSSPSLIFLPSVIGLHDHTVSLFAWPIDRARRMHTPRVFVWRTLLIGAIFASLSAPAAAAKKSKCDLPCRNGGVCSSSRRLVERQSFDMIGRLAQEESEAPEAQPAVPQESQQQPLKRNYCKCPPGFSGSLCEVKFITCENGEQKCRNGSLCERAVDAEGSVFFHCECDMERTDVTATPFAQKVCEKSSTVFCKVNAIVTDKKKKAKKDKMHSVSETAGSSFCYNNGSCKEATDKHVHHPGCNCPEGFSGPHCETSSVSSALSTKKKAYSRTPSSRSPRMQRLLSVAVFIGIMLLFLVGGVAYLVHHGNRHRRPRARPVATNITRSRKSAQERARIPKGADSEIEIV
jgi:hypothetical protein